MNEARGLGRDRSGEATPLPEYEQSMPVPKLAVARKDLQSTDQNQSPLKKKRKETSLLRKEETVSPPRWTNVKEEDEKQT